MRKAIHVDNARVQRMINEEDLRGVEPAELQRRIVLLGRQLAGERARTDETLERLHLFRAKVCCFSPGVAECALYSQCYPNR